MQEKEKSGNERKQADLNKKRKLYLFNRKH